MHDSHDVTRILEAVRNGSRDAVDELFPLVYQQLKRLAQSLLAHERPGHTLQATALVHEAYLKMVDQNRVEWQNRAHFFAVAATAIRRILVDYARRRGRQRRGGGWQRVSLEQSLSIPADDPDIDLIVLDEALRKLADSEPEKAKVVELRFFGGLSGAETAEALGISERTIRRHWVYAQAWLYREMTAAEQAES